MSLFSNDDFARKMMPLWQYLTRYFPKAHREVAKVCLVNNVRYNPGRNPTDLNWARNKSTDQLGSAFRHMTESAVDGKVFEDVPSDVAKITGIHRIYVLAEAMWRIGAELELTIEREESNAQKEPEPMKWPCEDENWPRLKCEYLPRPGAFQGHTCKQLPVGLESVDDAEGTYHGWTYRTDQKGRDAPRPGKEAFSTDYAIGHTHGSKEGAARRQKG
jgi:hypothetical protein